MFLKGHSLTHLLTEWVTRSPIELSAGQLKILLILCFFGSTHIHIPAFGPLCNPLICNATLPKLTPTLFCCGYICTTYKQYIYIGIQTNFPFSGKWNKSMLILWDTRHQWLYSPPNWASNWRTFFSNSVAWALASCHFNRDSLCAKDDQKFSQNIFPPEFKISQFLGWI